MRLRLGVIISAAVFWAGCVSGPPPLNEYVLARAALDAAKSVEAARHSPGFFRQSEENFLNGEKAFFDRDYKLAISLFKKSRLAAEKAENSARLLRAKSGEIF